MANSLLDFVISLLRDPDAAARYAADSARAISDAGLTDVTSADVQNLIPVVAESLSMAAPTHSFGAFGAEPADNVWASGAATAAFDAFADHVPEPAAAMIKADAIAAGIFDETGPGFDDLSSADPIEDVESLQPDGASALDDQAWLQDSGATEPGAADDWSLPVADPQPGDFTPGFDIAD